ncbi:hypothetical protein A9Q02_02060 [Candidatus Chloroploca asiatica]|uniref:Uncharacterized protein n=1 Tax=Candidatus Chloroploca asiatica TaxID=1506545 RepID=A0A2H3KTV9_9CHLR|nr:hypothetical protein A9Q02_02060 [Candidatus Chloroploca asiatica]
MCNTGAFRDVHNLGDLTIIIVLIMVMMANPIFRYETRRTNTTLVFPINCSYCPLPPVLLSHPDLALAQM